MKSKLIIILVLVMLMSFTSIGFAEEVKGRIIVSSEASVKLKPDTANLTFTIITNNKNQVKALEENNKISNNVVKELEKIKISKDDILSSSIYVEPVYDYEKDPSVIVNYRAVNNITVSTKKLDDLSKIVNTSIKAGANSLSNINYSNSNTNTSYYKALELAIKDANKKADMIGKTLNLKNLKPVLIEESSRNYVPVKESNLDLNMIKEESSSTTPIYIEDLEIYASVKIEFAY